MSPHTCTPWPLAWQDLTFVIDIFLTFNTIYFDDAHQRWVANRWHIVLNYLYGTALVDIVATVPFDLISLLASSSGLGDLHVRTPHPLVCPAFVVTRGAAGAAAVPK